MVEALRRAAWTTALPTFAWPVSKNYKTVYRNVRGSHYSISHIRSSSDCRNNYDQVLLRQRVYIGLLQEQSYHNISNRHKGAITQTTKEGNFDAYETTTRHSSIPPLMYVVYWNDIDTFASY